RCTYKEDFDLDFKRVKLAFDGFALLSPKYGWILRQHLYRLIVGVAPIGKVLNFGSHLLFQESHRRVYFILLLQVNVPKHFVKQRRRRDLLSSGLGVLSCLVARLVVNHSLCVCSARGDRYKYRKGAEPIYLSKNRCYAAVRLLLLEPFAQISTQEELGLHSRPLLGKNRGRLVLLTE